MSRLKAGCFFLIRHFVIYDLFSLEAVIFFKEMSVSSISMGLMEAYEVNHFPGPIYSIYSSPSFSRFEAGLLEQATFFARFVSWVSFGEIIMAFISMFIQSSSLYRVLFPDGAVSNFLLCP